MEKLRIVFMEPEFAVGIFDCIIKNNYTVVRSLLRIKQDADKK
jgi:hypothetical protein